MLLNGALTDFSTGKSILKPKALVNEAADKGYSSLVLADDYSLNGLPIAAPVAKEIGIKLIVGATIRVVDSLEDDLKGKFFEPKLLAKSEQGLADITRLLTKGNGPDNALKNRNLVVPRVELEDVLECVSRGNTVLATGSMFGLFSHTNWAKLWAQITARLPRESLAIELTPVHALYYQRMTANAIRAKMEMSPDVPVILARPALHEEGMHRDRLVHDCIVGHTKVESIFVRKPKQDLHPMAPKELVGELKMCLDHLVETNMIEPAWRAVGQEAVKNTLGFDGLFEYAFGQRDISLPKMADDPFAELVRQASEGWKRRIEQGLMGYTPPTDKLPEYKARLKHELTILRRMGFENYFLLVSQVVNWSKENAIMVGPGRGSAGGSLVAFLLGITDVDPIRFGLIFERFINPDRLDLPDIDLDFMSSRRGEVLEWLENTYGRDRVAGISNYVEIGSSQAIRSVGSAFGLIEPEFSCSKQVPKDSGTPVSLEQAVEEVPDIKRFSEQHREVWSAAVGLQGKLKSYGQHAAGVVVAGEPIENRAIIEDRGARVVNWDKNSCEKFGLVKLDILGLTTLDLLQNAREYLKEHTGETLDYLTLPMDDQEVLRAFSLGKTTGVFQFESGAAKHLLKEASSGSTLAFEDIYAITALNRPGPLQSGLTEQWVGIKQGALMPDYPHKSMIPALEETQSVIVYQEQVMQVARDLAGFSMAESDHLRKAMGKKDPEQMAKMREKFVQGASANMGEERAGILFDQIEQFAGYGFNKSHAVAYTVLSYWSMYVKVKHPAAFYAAALTVLGEEKRMAIIKDAKANGIEVMPPDINRSTLRFEIDWTASPPTLLAPLQMVKGLSERGVQAIFEAREKVGRPFESKQEFIDNVYRRSVNSRVQAALDAVGAFAAIEPSQLSPLDPSRLKDQKTLLPGLMVEDVKADRVMEIDEKTQLEVAKIVGAWQKAGETELGATDHPLPKMGRTPKIMLVSDYPNYTETREGKMGMGEACDDLNRVLKEFGIEEKMIYHTALCKTPKPKGGEITPDMIKVYGPFLREEINVLQPPVIVCLGSKSIRFMAPDVRGSWDELCGQAHYHADLDATVVFGMNPAMCHFDSTKLKNLKQAIKKVSELI